jgi:prevent-host-death family protein
MESVSKSELKRKMLAYFREVEASGEPLIVTDRGVPVLRVTPIRAVVQVEHAFADVRGKVVYHEDPVAPTTDEWDEP